MAKDKYEKGYGKRPLWQWILIYIIIGGIIYAAIYYFFLNKNYSYNNPSPRSQGGARPTATSAPSEKIVTVTASEFTPQTITIKAGETVIWTNQSGKVISINSEEHPSHQVYPPLNLGEVVNGGSVSLVFDEPGTYRYHNHYNPDQVGVVEVQ